MVTTPAVSNRCPVLARCVELSLSCAILSGEPSPMILFEDQDGRVHECKPLDPVSPAEIREQAEMLAGEFMASATISCFPAIIHCEDGEVEAIVVVTHDFVEDEANFVFCVASEDEATGVVEVTVLDADGLREVAGA